MPRAASNKSNASSGRAAVHSIGRKATNVAAIVALALMPVRLAAASLHYPRTDLPDNGGRFGITMDTTPYTFHGITVIKVIDVLRTSPLHGIVRPGDFIYGVNGFNLRSFDDIFAVVSSGAPGQASTIYYFDAANGYKAMQVTVNVISPALAKQDDSKAVAPATTPPSFCEEHYIVCGLGLVVAAAAVVGAVNGTDSGSDAGSTYVDDNAGFQQRQAEEASARAQAERDANAAAANAQWQSLQQPNSLGW